MKHLFSLPAVTLGLAVVYFCAGKLGLSLAFLNASATAVWPPTGIALVAMLAWGPRVWPGVFVAAFLVNLTTQGSFWTSLGIAAGNTLEAVVGAWLVCRYANGRNAFEQTQTIFKYIFLAGMLSTAVSATIGVTTLCLGGFARWDACASIWSTWWIGDLVSDVVFAPLLLIWSTRPRPRWKFFQIIEGLLMAITLLLLGQMVFGGWIIPREKNYPVEFLAIPPLLWAAWRFGLRGGSAAAFGMSVIAITGTLRGFGPFATQDPNAALLLLETFMAAIGLIALVLASVVEERNRVLIDLEGRVAERTAELRGTIDSLEGFCYSIAHDLRAPLRYINGFTRVLLQDYAPTFDQPGRDYAHRVTEATEKMDKLINDLLDYGRLSSAKLPLELVNTDKILRQAVEQLLLEYSDAGAVVNVESPLPPVLAHPLVIEQVALNLLRNAAKFVAPNVAPRIRVAAETASGRVRIWIRDNGIGIDPAHHAKIFGVFERLHIEQNYPGTGIGLAIVQKGVERMGGRVGLESKPGEGSGFWFELKSAEILVS